MNPIKVIIKKKFARNKFELEKYWIVDKIIIDKYSALKTEGNLAWYFFKKFGVGRYLFINYYKGINRKKTWKNGKKVFIRPSESWTYRMTLFENGYERDKDINQEIYHLEKELRSKDMDFETRSMIEEEISLEREFAFLEKRNKKRGPYGLKKRPYGLNAYEEFY